jgi:NAD(P)-dependent dehydrogenase (short-subunit alcohol dehydrogenase family)
MPELRVIQIDESIKGRITIVTGGAKGIGEGISRVLSSAGAHVVVADRDEPAAEKLAASLRAAGAGATAISCDVGDTAAVMRAVKKIERVLGAVDLLVNNAGIGDFVSFPEISRERWDRMLNVHLTGAYNCCHAVMPDMLRRRFGRVVNVSSVAGKRGDFIGNAHYTAAKAGMIGLTKSLAAWAAPYDVRVNAIAPGIVATELTREMSQSHRATTISRIPLGRFARPDEIASVVLFLLSDASSYVIGETINVNGGSYLD